MGILSRALQPVTNRWHPAQWPSDLAKDPAYKWLFGSQSYTGKSVSEEESLSATAVWSARLQLSESVASLPLHLYKRQGRGKDRAKNHRLYNIMHLNPNPEMSSMDFRSALMCQVTGYGVCYAEKQKDGNGDVIGLWPLLSKDVKPDRIAGQLVYTVRIPGSGKAKVLDASRVLRIPGFSADGLMGYSPIEKGMQSIALALALEEYGATFFGNGARPDAVLEHPGLIDEEAQDRLRKSWNEMHQGLSNSHRIAILEEGMRLKEFSSNPQTAQAIETRKFQIEEVARIFNMPVHMLKNLDRSTNNNIEFQGHEFVIYTLRYWLVRFEQNYTIQLLSEKEQKKYFFEHLVDGLLRGDTQTRHAAYATGRQWGYYSANDVREIENLNPIGPEGDIYLVPLNMIPADQAGQEPEPPEFNPFEPPEGEEDFNEKREKIESFQEKIKFSKENQEERNKKLLGGINRIVQSYQRIIKRTAQEIVNREAIAVKKAVKKHLEERGVSGFGTWMDNFYKIHSGFIYDKLNPILKSYQEIVAKEAGSVIGGEIGAGDLEAFFDKTVKNYVYHHIHSSSGQLEKIIRETPVDELAPAINKRMDEWFNKRANKISRDESVRLANAVSRETWIRQGVTKIRWQTQGKNCPFCDSLNGRIVGIEDSFFEPGEVLYVDAQTGESDIYDPDTGQFKEKQLAGSWKERESVQALKITGTKFHPPIHLGCDCRIVPEVETSEGLQANYSESPMSSIGDLANCVVVRSIGDIEVRKIPSSCNDYVRVGNQWMLNGKPVDDADFLKRTKAMRIPPAWKNVSVSLDPKAKVQAVGLDAAGRWQYRYSAEHIREANVKKFNRVKSFSRDMPKIRESIDAGIKINDERAYLLRMEDKTAIRIGSNQDFKAKKKAYGLTTLQNEHVQIKGEKIILDFVAKEGIPARYKFKDKILSDWLTNKKKGLVDGDRLFPDTPAPKLNQYLKDISGGDYSVKDFRTYHGTRIAHEELKQYAGKNLTLKQKRKIVKEVSEKASAFLKNTPVMARNSYIDPMAWETIGGL